MDNPSSALTDSMFPDSEGLSQLFSHHSHNDPQPTPAHSLQLSLQPYSCIAFSQVTSSICCQKFVDADKCTRCWETSSYIKKNKTKTLAPTQLLRLYPRSLWKHAMFWLGIHEPERIPFSSCSTGSSAETPSFTGQIRKS